jgi:lipopolysaccharide export system permease protein
MIGVAGIGWTLGAYFAGRFLQAIMVVFFTVFALIYLIDFVELLRRAGDSRGASTLALAHLAFLRVPAIAEQVLPFAILFGAIGSFLALSRRLELVIARAAGVSVWQFGAPAMLSALAIGLFAVLAYNPGAVAMKRQADRIEAKLFARAAEGRGTDVWLRQRSVDGQAVIRATRSADDGATLGDVTVFVFDERNEFIERIDAAEATLRPGHWRITNARILTLGIEPQAADTYLLPTSLTRQEVRQSLGAPEAVSFWNLPATIRQLEAAGLDSTRYRLRHQSLLARPLLLAAMVIVAASVSLRFFRFGGVAKMVLSGVAAGFMLYVATQVAQDLGSAGLLSAPVASWLPAIMGSLLGTLVLLHQEDG